MIDTHAALCRMANEMIIIVLSWVRYITHTGSTNRAEVRENILPPSPGIAVLFKIPNILAACLTCCLPGPFWLLNAVFKLEIRNIQTPDVLCPAPQTVVTCRAWVIFCE